MTLPTPPDRLLTTERLTLRPFETGDVPDIHRTLYSDPEVMRYLPGGVPRPIEASHKSIAYFIQHWHDHGYGGFAVIHRADQSFIGQCGLNRLSDGAVELFYAIAAPYWGQGLTTEGSRAVLEYGFTVALLPRIIGLTFPENLPSQRVLLKLGMTAHGVTEHYYQMPMHYFTLERSAWLEKTR